MAEQAIADAQDPPGEIKHRPVRSTTTAQSRLLGVKRHRRSSFSRSCVSLATADYQRYIVYHLDLLFALLDSQIARAARNNPSSEAKGRQEPRTLLIARCRVQD